MSQLYSEKPAVWSFVAMQFYGLILNRTFKVFVTDRFINAVRVKGMVSSPLFATNKWNDPEFYVNPNLAQQYQGTDFNSVGFLKIDKANFRIERAKIARINCLPYKWGMGAVPYSGRLVIYTSSGKEHEFIILGRQNIEAINSCLLGKEPAPQVVAATGINQDSNIFLEEKTRVEKQQQNGANWFLWIAGLSIINSLSVMIGSRWSFFVGLGTTQFIDGMAIGLIRYLGSGNGIIIVRVIVFALNLAVAGIFAIFGVLSRKKYTWAFIVGMILYMLDAIVFLLVSDYLSIGFHLLVLFWIFNGLKANQKLKLQSVPQAESSPQISQIPG